MRCEEIEERFVDLLYDERGTPPASAELKGHLLSCPDCRARLETLRQTRQALAGWEDERPLRPYVHPAGEWMPGIRRPPKWRWVRYAAVAAMLAFCFLAAANTEVRWNRDGMSIRTSFFPGADTEGTYTKAEVRDLLRQVVNDSEVRILETNYLMMQRMLETLEQERWETARLVSQRSQRNGARN